MHAAFDLVAEHPLISGRIRPRRMAWAWGRVRVSVPAPADRVPDGKPGRRRRGRAAATAYASDHDERCAGSWRHLFPAHVQTTGHTTGLPAVRTIRPESSFQRRS